MLVSNRGSQTGVIHSHSIPSAKGAEVKMVVLNLLMPEFSEAFMLSAGIMAPPSGLAAWHENLHCNSQIQEPDLKAQVNPSPSACGSCGRRLTRPITGEVVRLAIGRFRGLAISLTGSLY